jgi:acyl carrier protein
MITADRVLQFIAERLGVDVSVLSDDVGVGDLPEWDSLAQVMLVTAAEQEFSTTIDIDIAFGLETVGDFVAFLTSLN